MAFAEVTYTVSDPPPSPATYSIPFGFLQQRHISVERNGSTAGVTFVITGSDLEVTAPGLIAGDLITIKRTTPVNTTGQAVQFTDGSTLRRSDLETSRLQTLYQIQELTDDLTSGLRMDLADSTWDAEDLRIKNVADPTAAQDAATRAWVLSQIVSSGAVPAFGAGDVGKYLGVIAGPNVDWTSPPGGEIHLLRIKSQTIVHAGQKNGWVLPPFASGYTDSTQRAPLEVVAQFNASGDFGLAANTFDFTLGAGKWVIEVDGHLRGLTNTGNTNSTTGQLALTDTSGNLKSNGEGAEIITGYAVEVQDSGGAITRTGQLSGHARIVYLANIASGTESFNLRGIGSTSSHNVVADIPTYVKITRIA